MVERSGTGPGPILDGGNSQVDKVERDKKKAGMSIQVRINPTYQRVTCVSEREEKARQKIVLDIIRAKRQFGLTGRDMELSFFKDLWPDIFDHLQRTGFVNPSNWRK